MARNIFRVPLGVPILSMVIALTGCEPFSIVERRSSAGLNGSFEIVQSKLPVNWHIHYPPLKKGDAELSLDTTSAVEGKQSLKLAVARADATGGWRTAGFFQVVPAQAKRSYKVSFWLKNQGCKVSLTIRSEKPKEGPPPLERVLGEDETGIDTWRRFEYVYRVPEAYDNIRFDLTVIQPGTLWIDDVRIEEIETN